jgi:hypothetical protein
MNIVGPAIFTPVIVIIAVAGLLVATGETLLFVSGNFGHTVAVAFDTFLMFAYTLGAWAAARGQR